MNTHEVGQLVKFSTTKLGLKFWVWCFVVPLAFAWCFGDLVNGNGVQPFIVNLAVVLLAPVAMWKLRVSQYEIAVWKEQN